MAAGMETVSVFSHKNPFFSMCYHIFITKKLIIINIENKEKRWIKRISEYRKDVIYV